LVPLEIEDYQHIPAGYVDELFHQPSGASREQAHLRAKFPELVGEVYSEDVTHSAADR
jgi:hypothetical protein